MEVIVAVILSGIVSYLIAVYTSKKELKKLDISHQHELTKTVFDQRLQAYRMAFKTIKPLLQIKKGNFENKSIDIVDLIICEKELNFWFNNYGSTILSEKSLEKYHFLLKALKEFGEEPPDQDRLESLRDAAKFFRGSLRNDIKVEEGISTK